MQFVEDTVARWVLQIKNCNLEIVRGHETWLGGVFRVFTEWLMCDTADDVVQDSKMSLLVRDELFFSLSLSLIPHCSIFWGGYFVIYFNY